MIVRDMMRKLEDEAICEREKELGRKLNDEEREAVVVEVCDRVRAKFDADPVMLEDSRRVFEFIEDENIPKVKERHNPANEPFTAKGVKVLSSPLDIIGVL